MRILFIVVLASRLKLSLLPDSEPLPITRSLGTPIAPRIKVDNLSWSETVEAVTSLRTMPALIAGRLFPADAIACAIPTIPPAPY